MRNKFWFTRYMDVANDGASGGAAGGSGGSDDSANKGGAGDDSNKGNASGEGDDAGKGKQTSDAEAALLKESMKRKEKIAELEKQLAANAAQLKQFEGIDPVAAKELVANQKALEVKKLEEQGKWELLKQSMGEEHKAEVAKREQTIADLQAKLDAAAGNVNELTIGAQFNNSVFIKEKMLLTPTVAKVVYSPNFDYEDGKLVGYDKPKGSANRAPLVDATGNPLSFDLALQKLVEADPEKDSLLRSTVKTGANSNTETKTKFNTNDKAELSGLEKISAGIKGLIKP